eukprot:GDKH01003984.1.p1 GENE.GDKH01003984.1~~GDKH01003984.1.p1  ORF type:complete len:264 (+),score=-51.49 GDKH01003984.1:72-794(+)
MIHTHTQRSTSVAHQHTRTRASRRPNVLLICTLARCMICMDGHIHCTQHTQTHLYTHHTNVSTHTHEQPHTHRVTPMLHTRQHMTPHAIANITHHNTTCTRTPSQKKPSASAVHNNIAHTLTHTRSHTYMRLHMRTSLHTNTRASTRTHAKQPANTPQHLDTTRTHTMPGTNKQAHTHEIAQDNISPTCGYITHTHCNIHEKKHSSAHTFMQICDTHTYIRSVSRRMHAYTHNHSAVSSS